MIVTIHDLERDYRTAMQQFPEYADKLFDSKIREKVEIKIAIRAILWKKYGCTYREISEAESIISGSKISINAIQYSIRVYHQTLKREIPEIIKKIEEAIL